ncbi:MAG: transporter, partial [Halomonadaceae bacterium]
MNAWVMNCRLLAVTGLVLLPALVVGNEIEDARAALAQQEEDEDTTRQLEEVFEAAERQYSLIGRGNHSLNYSFDYTYAADQRLDVQIINNSVRNLDVEPQATHNFTNAFNYDYGLLNNLTLGVRVPLVTKFDTQED